MQFSSKSILACLIGIILFSFWLRLWGIQFGLPFVYHPDEQQYILPAIGVVSGNFEPLAHYNPALYPYLIGFVYTLIFLGLKLFNAFPTSFDLGAGWSEPMLPWITGIVYLARYISAVVGVLTTLLIYQVGRRAYSQRTGLAAAAIFGLTFLPVREAHFAVSDAPVALGVAVTLYLCLAIVRHGNWPGYVWAGVALGLSAATKYSAGLLILPLGVAHLLSRRYHRWFERLYRSWLLLLAGLAATISYLVASPYTLLEREEFWADFSENLESARVGFQGLDLDPAGGAVFYLKSLIWGFGWPVFILFLAALIFACWRRRREDILLLILPLMGFFYMQRQEMYFVRWLMPFLPPLAVLAGETIHVVTRFLAVRWGKFLQPQTAQLSSPWLPLGVTILLVLPSLYVAIQADAIFCRLDTRTEAMEWIRQNIPPGSTIAAEVLSPPWGPPLAMPGLAIGPYNLTPVPNGGVAELDLQQLLDWRVQYVVASSFYYARPLRDKSHQAALAGRLQTLAEKAELVAQFQPYKDEYQGFFYHDQVYGPANDTLYREQPGPVIRIYRLW
jgi:4-amino-4-deoxy-L-arabinose transferase-like glycosyltransferase